MRLSKTQMIYLENWNAKVNKFAVFGGELINLISRKLF